MWIARALARELGNTEIVPVTDPDPQKRILDSTVIGMVFPVHIWGVPRRVLKFLEDIKSASPEYIFAVAVNGGQVSNTLVQLKKFMESKDLFLSNGWSIQMPSNYIPWGGPGSEAAQGRLFGAAAQKASLIAEDIRERVEAFPEKGPLWQRIIFTGLYKLTFPMVPKMDSKFWVDQRCNQCGVCAEVCPAGNIEIKEGRLVWHNQCEQCLACIQWCPQEALQYGKKTPAYKRYHHPEILLKDIIKK